MEGFTMTKFITQFFSQLTLAQLTTFFVRVEQQFLVYNNCQFRLLFI